MISKYIDSAFVSLAGAAVLLAASGSAAAEVVEKSKNIAGVSVHYKVVLPSHYDAAKAYPGVLAFGGGPQTMNIVDGAIQRNWRDEAERRGYIVVIPAAPDGQLFFEGGERIFPEFLTKILADYKIADNKFHIAGQSNGGISAFHVAATYPQYFWSVTGFPGYLPDATPARVGALAKMCINMHVGELDTGWKEEMQQQAAQFRAKGMTVRITVEKGQSHRLDTLAGDGAARLFNQFEEARQGCSK
ncbi:MAG TPA: alpha/beta hydrolase-fold protein [Bryobacteraceae bacterium]|jgi:poly(3-hydroxybutyrate) depolymerase|nr:alpha/beta hydrolase-fold protein [Bryobacteraceae bacterium]